MSGAISVLNGWFPAIKITEPYSPTPRAKASAKHFEVETVQFWEGGLSVVNASKEHGYIIRQTADELLA